MTNTRFSFLGPIDDRLLFDTSAVVLNMHSTSTDDELIPKCYSWATLLGMEDDWSWICKCSKDCFFSTPLRYVNSDSGQHQTTSLQCTQAVERLFALRQVDKIRLAEFFFSGYAYYLISTKPA